jgi:hypothetical protein
LCAYPLLLLLDKSDLLDSALRSLDPATLLAWRSFIMEMVFVKNMSRYNNNATFTITNKATTTTTTIYKYNNNNNYNYNYIIVVFININLP